MIDLLMNEPTASAVILLAIGWVIYSIKYWLFGIKIDKLTNDQIEQQKKIDAIPAEVNKMTTDDIVNYWNDKDKR